MAERPKRIRNRDKKIPVKVDGTPKALKTDGTPDRRGTEKTGGPMPNSGRKPRIKHLSNYHKALKMFDDNVEDAIQVLVDSFLDPDPHVRIRAAEIFLKKTIADKKQNELVGPGGGPVTVTKAEWQGAIDEIDELIDKKIEEKKRGKVIETTLIKDDSSDTYKVDDEELKEGEE